MGVEDVVWQGSKPGATRRASLAGELPRLRGWREESSVENPGCQAWVDYCRGCIKILR